MCIHSMRNAVETQRELEKDYEGHAVMLGLNAKGKFLAGEVVDVTNMKKIKEMVRLLNHWHGSDGLAVVSMEYVNKVRLAMDLPAVDNKGDPFPVKKALTIEEIRELDEHNKIDFQVRKLIAAVKAGRRIPNGDNAEQELMKRNEERPVEERVYMRA